MKHHEQEFPVEKMAEVLGVSRSGYYRFVKRKPSARDQKNQQLKEEIRLIHQRSHETYGSPRIHADNSLLVLWQKVNLKIHKTFFQKIFGF